MKKNLFLTTILCIVSIQVYAQQLGDGYAPTMPDFSQPVLSGFYGQSNPVAGLSIPGWQHLMVVRHSNPINNHQLQIASSFAVDDRLFFRKIAMGTLDPLNSAWNEIATRGANTFNGNQIVTGNIGIDAAGGKIGFNVDDSFNAFGRSNAHYGLSYNSTYSPIVLSGYYGISLFSKGNERIRIDENGNLGIGTISPTQKLTVDSRQPNSNTGSPALNGTSQNGIMRLQVDGNSWGEVIDFGMNVMPSYAWVQATNRDNLELNYDLLLNPNGGNIGIGTKSPDFKLTVVDNSKAVILGLFGGYVYGDYSYTKQYIGQTQSAGKCANIGYMAHQSNPMSSGFYLTNYGDAEGTTGFFVKRGGFVGIGTTTPDAMLTVNGVIHAREVRVDLTGSLADYVFNSEYPLMPLHKVESYVKTNNRLPDMPSADEVKSKGLNMGEMQNKLLQKIEELTLYVIELKKTNDTQNEEIKQLKLQLKK